MSRVLKYVVVSARILGRKKDGTVSLGPVCTKSRRLTGQRAIYLKQIGNEYFTRNFHWIVTAAEAHKITL